MNHPVRITRVRVGTWTPDAWVGDDGDVELAVTDPLTPTQIIIVIPAQAALAWAASAATAIGGVHDRIVGNPGPLS